MGSSVVRYVLLSAVRRMTGDAQQQGWLVFMDFARTATWTTGTLAQIIHCVVEHCGVDRR